MFYMLANVRHQIAIGEVLLPHQCFWYILPNLRDPEHFSVILA
jgi:hypothetical protein